MTNRWSRIGGLLIIIALVVAAVASYRRRQLDLDEAAFREQFDRGN